MSSRSRCWTLGFEPTTEFIRSSPAGITAGGIVGLEGVHPTTSGYSLIAHECMKVMKACGVRFLTPTGEERADPPVGFARRARGHAELAPAEIRRGGAGAARPARRSLRADGRVRARIAPSKADVGAIVSLRGPGARRPLR
jgi:hypothetical protein